MAELDVVLEVSKRKTNSLSYKCQHNIDPALSSVLGSIYFKEKYQTIQLPIDLPRSKASLLCRSFTGQVCQKGNLLYSFLQYSGEEFVLELSETW